MTNQSPAKCAGNLPGNLANICAEADNDKQFTTALLQLIPALRMRARRLCGSCDLSSDLVQVTLTKAWEARGTFVFGTNLKAWLFTIMRNHFCSESRRTWRQARWDQGSAERMAAAGDEQVWALYLSDALHALSQLSDVHREALIVMGVGGYSAEDAAVICRCRTAAMKSRVSRARRSLRSIMDGGTPLRRSHRVQDDATGAILALLNNATRSAAPVPRDNSDADIGISS